MKGMGQGVDGSNDISYERGKGKGGPKRGQAFLKM
jgi:hypothetical protein